MNHTTTMRGGALVLVILLMLSLSMFGVLSMVSANADFRLAQKSAGWIEAYYRLENDGCYRLYQAEIMAGKSGFASLATAGWDVSGDEASINLTEGVQNLHIAVVQDGGSLRVISWKQWQEGFAYEQDGSDVLIMDD